ncbi:ABC transporter substrate-binding protein [Cellulomonas pakistanensis]|uniref:ABC transporter substrate-binding protein n=1 Tax=Cellulomonas pakistanensis TaxID=992287 RepID=UPI001941AE3A|nr:ABC transporter substrate-binding protein [Cellulomonas pakistanensis]
MTRSFTARPRRRIAGLAATVAAAGLLLSACSSDDTASGGSSEAAEDFQAVSVQLSWLKNQQFAGEYLAVEDGLYTDAGFPEVTLTAGGSSATSAEAAVASGQAFVGLSSPLITAPAIQSGAELKIVGATYQLNPFALVSAASAPIEGPDDLAGKTIAVSDSNTLVWNAFLAANELDEADVTTVPLSDTSMLTTGQVDGFIGYTTTGAAALAEAGFEATEFLLADNGLPMVGEVLVTSQQAIDERPEEVKAFLLATAEGWRAALDDPERAVDLTVNTYGKDQQYDADAIALSFDRQATLIETDETAANGLLTISDELQEGTIASLGFAGVEIAADELFDLSLLDEVYAENPDLLS